MLAPCLHTGSGYRPRLSRYINLSPKRAGRLIRADTSAGDELQREPRRSTTNLGITHVLEERANIGIFQCLMMPAVRTLLPQIRFGIQL